MPENLKQRITIPALSDLKKRGIKITALTAYDYPTAKILDKAGIDLILVGDSLGMVVLGYEDTIPVTMDEMIHHTRAVVRGVFRALVVGDMPAFSYHISEDSAVANAVRFIQEAGARAIKIEGALPRRLRLIERLVEADIPVMGHVGLTPQSVCRLDGFKVQGKRSREAREILRDARRLEAAGAFAVVLECIPMELARIITESLTVPTIGIGAGPFCDGQILVFHDLVGYSNGYLPKFVRRYADMGAVLGDAASEYAADVRGGAFPEDRHSFHLKRPLDLAGLEKRRGEGGEERSGDKYSGSAAGSDKGKDPC